MVWQKSSSRRPVSDRGFIAYKSLKDHCGGWKADALLWEAVVPQPFFPPWERAVTSPLASFSVSAQEGAHVSTNCFACSDPMERDMGLRIYCSVGLLFLQGKDWFSCSTFFFSIRGERVKYLFAYLLYSDQS